MVNDSWVAIEVTAEEGTMIAEEEEVLRGEEAAAVVEPLTNFLRALIPVQIIIAIII